MLFEREGDVLIDSRAKHLCFRILKDEPDVAAKLIRAVKARRYATDRHRPAEPPSRKVGNQPIERAQQGGLPGPGRSHQQRHLSRIDIPVLMVERGPLAIRIAK